MWKHQLAVSQGLRRLKKYVEPWKFAFHYICHMENSMVKLVSINWSFAEQNKKSKGGVGVKPQVQEREISD